MSWGSMTIDYKVIAGKAVREMNAQNLQRFVVVCALVSDLVCPGCNRALSACERIRTLREPPHDTKSMRQKSLPTFAWNYRKTRSNRATTNRKPKRHPNQNNLTSCRAAFSGAGPFFHMLQRTPGEDLRPSYLPNQIRFPESNPIRLLRLSFHKSHRNADHSPHDVRLTRKRKPQYFAF